MALENGTPSVDHDRASENGRRFGPTKQSLPVPTSHIDNPQYASVDDRRETPRHRSIFRIARLSCPARGVDRLAIVRNISEGGIKVVGCSGLQCGDAVRVSLTDDRCMDGAILWLEENSCGIRFANQIQVEKILARNADQSTARRPRAPRLQLNLPVTFRSGCFILDAQIIDISQRGAKLLLHGLLPIETRVQVAYANNRPIGGNVRWQSQRLVGIEFHRLLSIEELSHWFDQARDNQHARA